MTTPGTIVQESAASPTGGDATSTGTAFLVAEFTRGPVTPRAIRSYSDLLDTYGPFASYSFGYDAAETFYSLDGGRLIVQRAVSATAVAATASIGTGRLTATASSPGAWGNDLTVTVVAGVATGTYVLVVTSIATGLELERSPELLDQAAAIDWGRDRLPGESLGLRLSQYLRITAGGTSGNPPVAGPVALLTGNDDRTNVTNTAWQTAIDAIGPEWGPGQLTIPGITTDPVHVAATDHALARNRIALLDGVRGSTVTQLVTAAAAIKVRPGARHAVLFGQSARIAPRAGSLSLRTVPYSIVQAALTSAYDATGKLGDAVAGDLGRSDPRFVLALDRDFTDTDRGTLNDAGVSVARTIGGVVRTYSDRACTSVTLGDVDYESSNQRTLMGIRAELEQVAEQFFASKQDAKGSKLAAAQGAAAGVCKRHYDGGALYGVGDDDAYTVTASFDLSTQILRVRALVTPSPGAQQVVVELARRSPTT